MPQVSVTRRHGVAAVVGAALATAGLFGGGGFATSDAPATDTIGASVTTTTSPPIIAAGETLIGNTILVPLSVRAVGNDIVFDYSLTGLGGAVVTAVPERFVLTTPEGTDYEGSLSSPDPRSVRFEGVADEAVEAITVTQWRQRMYEEYDTTLSLTDGAALSDGTFLAIDRVLDETIGALVYFTVTLGSDRGFGSSEFIGPLLITSGDGWQDVLDVHSTGSGLTAASLSVTVDPLPETYPLHVVARPWVAMEDRLVVYRTGAGT